MKKDRLFTLKPGFTDHGEGPFFCPGSVKVEGMLVYFPELRERIDVIHIEFPRPRREIVELIGEENQGAPVLVLGEESSRRSTFAHIREAKGVRFVSNSDHILRYLSETYGVARPHH